MTKKERMQAVTERLKQVYPEAVCALHYTHDYELLFATRLSAQCTDARVNIVTEKLFSDFPTLESFAEASEEEIAEDIRSCGLFRTKARDLHACAVMLLAEYGGRVPDTMEELLRLPGVGRKTANLILGDIFGKPAIVCDTAVQPSRLCSGREGPGQGGKGAAGTRHARRVERLLSPPRAVRPGALHRPCAALHGLPARGHLSVVRKNAVKNIQIKQHSQKVFCEPCNLLSLSLWKE